MYLDEIKQKLDFIPKNEIKPYSVKQVDLLERKLGFKVPEAFKEFLFWGGKKLGKLFDNDYVSYPDYLKITKSCKFEMNEVGITPPDNMIVLTNNYGTYNFICSDVNENPPVYQFFFAKGVEEEFDSFTEYLIQIIKDFYGNSIFTPELKKLKFLEKDTKYNWGVINKKSEYIIKEK